MILNQIKKIINKFSNRQGAKNSDIIPLIKNNLSSEVISILDIGCGKLWDGNSEEEDILLSLFKERKYEITGVDIFKDCIDWRKENGPKGEYIQLDMRNIDALNRKYDLIIAHHVLEHLTKDESLLLLKNIELKAKKTDNNWSTNWFH